MNNAKQYNLNDIVVGVVRDMQPISGRGIWLEIGEALNAYPTPSQQEVNLSLDQMEKRKILKKIKFPDGREQYVMIAQ